MTTTQHIENKIIKDLEIISNKTLTVGNKNLDIKIFSCEDLLIYPDIKEDKKYILTVNNQFKKSIRNLLKDDDFDVFENMEQIDNDINKIEQKINKYKNSDLLNKALISKYFFTQWNVKI